LKTTFVKAVLGFLFFCLIENNTSAGLLPNPADTGRKNLLASIEKNNKEITLKEANVVYPAIFWGHEKQSMDYIEKFSVTRRDYLVRTFSRGKKYFPKAAAILKKYKVPAEYKVLLALESGFNRNAKSKAGAVGYWQFMDVVAREYGLKISETTKDKTLSKRGNAKNKHTTITKKRTSTDDRKNFTKSTSAAARYLRDRIRNLDNDWLLIAASYNCGVGNVWDAIKRTGKSDPSFWEIKKYLPKETSTYVMNFIALNVIFHNYEKFSKNNLCFRPVTAKVENFNKNESDKFPELIIND